MAKAVGLCDVDLFIVHEILNFCLILCQLSVILAIA